MRPEIIAEIGWNHMGDMNLASRMIKEAKESEQILLNSKLGRYQDLKTENGIMMGEEKFIKMLSYQKMSMSF